MRWKSLYLFFILFYSFNLHVSISAQPINAEKLNALLKRAEETHSEAVIIFKEGKLVSESYYGIGNSNRVIESMSCTKSIVGLAVACLISDNLIDSLRTPVYKFYPEWNQGSKKRITIEHLVNMTSGIQNEMRATEEIYPSPDFVQLALSAELTSSPGTVWSYNNKALNLLAGLVKKITGKRMDDYIAARLFEPLEIKEFKWTLDSVGNPHVMSGCQLKPLDFAKIGLLLLNKGEYMARRVIAEDAINILLTPCNLFEGYAGLWWLDYENTKSIVDDSCIRKLRDANLEKQFMEKVEKMKGEYFSDKEYFSKIDEVFGANPWEYINAQLGENLRIRRREYSGRISYRADGYLGNYIIVDPASNIVAIRMISWESCSSEEDFFSDFKSMVLDLRN